MTAFEKALQKQFDQNLKPEENGFDMDGLPLPRLPSKEDMKLAESGKGVEFGIDIDDPFLENIDKEQADES